MLAVNLLFDVERGTDGMRAVSRFFGVSGYGPNETVAQADMLDRLGALLDSFESIPETAMDRSALNLRQALRKQLAKASF